MTNRSNAAALCAFALLACRSDIPSKSSGSSNVPSGPCDLATASDVKTAFGVAVDSGVVGIAKNCQFKVTNAGSSGLQEVNVFYYQEVGPSTWARFRDGFVQNRGGVTDRTEVGDKAFHPNDQRGNEIAVLSGSIVFEVGSLSIGQSDRSAATLALAKVIAAKHR